MGTFIFESKKTPFLSLRTEVSTALSQCPRVPLTLGPTHLSGPRQKVDAPDKESPPSVLNPRICIYPHKFDKIP